ncbi:MAG TPA: CBS domain-containing protein [Solirubrobacteraceae bacterium]|nr:CBS domain-containing protein [Solirubrobacteraceae bacterium]
MSPRAACRLDTLGFEHVHDYLPSKVDWLARGLPTEGENAGQTRAGDLARDDIVTCRPDSRMADVRPRAEASPYAFALVTTEDGTLVGRLRKTALEADPQAVAEQAMEPGPSTVRAHLPAEEVAARMTQRGLSTVVVTSPDGTLLGVVRRQDTQAAAGR